MPKNTNQTSSRMASLASETLRSSSASQAAKSLAASTLSQRSGAKQTGVQMEQVASRVLRSEKFAASTKELAASVLSQSTKRASCSVSTLLIWSVEVSKKTMDSSPFEPDKARATTRSTRGLSTTQLLSICGVVAAICIPISVVLAVTYHAAFFAHFGIDEEWVRPELLSLHLAAYYISLQPMLSIAVAATTILIVLLVAQPLLFVGADALNRLVQALWRRKLQRMKRREIDDLKSWADRMDRSLTTLATAIAFVFVATAALALPAAVGQKKGSADAKDFEERGYVRNDPSGLGLFDCAVFERRKDTVESALLLRCGTGDCAVIWPDLTTSILPKSAVLEVRHNRVAKADLANKSAPVRCADAHSASKDQVATSSEAASGDGSSQSNASTREY